MMFENQITGFRIPDVPTMDQLQEISKWVRVHAGPKVNTAVIGDIDHVRVWVGSTKIDVPYGHWLLRTDDRFVVQKIVE
jgi:hypothetical protein